jgi:MFS family permease
MDNAKIINGSKSDSNFRSWAICFVASLFFFYEILQLTIFNTISGDLTRTFSLSTLQLSRLSASYLYACAIFLLPAGLLLDRFSTKKLLAVTSCLCAVGTGLIPIASTVELATLGRILTGIGNTIAFLGCMRLVSRWFPANTIALAMGLSVTIGMTGGIISQAPFALLVNIAGWQQAMFINAAIGGIITLLIIFTVKDAPKQYTLLRPHIEKIMPTGFFKSLKKTSSNSQNWLCGIYTGLLNLPVMMIGALWGNLYLTQGRGFSAMQAGNITSLIFFGLIIGAPLMGWISDKLNSRRKPMLISSCTIFLVILAIIYLHLPIIILGILFFILGILSSSQVLSYPIVSKSNPPHLESTSLALVAILVNIGGAVSQLLFGWLVNLKWDGLMKNGIPIHTLSAYQFALIMLPLAFLISLLAAALIHDTSPRSSSKINYVSTTGIAS